MGMEPLCKLYLLIAWRACHTSESEHKRRRKGLVLALGVCTLHAFCLQLILRVRLEAGFMRPRNPPLSYNRLLVTLLSSK